MEKDLEQNFHERKSRLILLAIGEKKKIVVLRQDCIDLDYEGQIMSIFNY